jgi:hypothetical protein
VIENSVRTEDDDKSKEKGGEPEEKGLEPNGICKDCGHQMRAEAKFCDQCGDSMEAAPLEDDSLEGEGGDGDKPGKKDPAPKSDAAKTGSIAAVFGLRDNASALAIKTAALKLRDSMSRVMAATFTETADAAVGAVLAHASDVKRLAEVEGENKALRARASHTERMDLLHKLAAANIPGMPRGELLVDVVADDGTKKVQPSKMYREMKLGTLRELSARKLKDAPVARRANPFEPDAKSAQAASEAGAAQIVANDPLVRKIAESSSAPADRIAASFAALSATWNQ